MGRKPFLLLAIIGAAVQMFLLGVSFNVTTLVIATLIRGLFDCTFTVSASSIADWAKRKDYGKSFGLMGAAIGVAFAVGT